MKGALPGRLFYRMDRRAVCPHDRRNRGPGSRNRIRGRECFAEHHGPRQTLGGFEVFSQPVFKAGHFFRGEFARQITQSFPQTCAAGFVGERWKTISHRAIRSLSKPVPVCRARVACGSARFPTERAGPPPSRQTSTPRRIAVEPPTAALPEADPERRESAATAPPARVRVADHNRSPLPPQWAFPQTVAEPGGPARVGRLRPDAAWPVPRSGRPGTTRPCGRPEESPRRAPKPCRTWPAPPRGPVPDAGAVPAQTPEAVGRIRDTKPRLAQARVVQALVHSQAVSHEQCKKAPRSQNPCAKRMDYSLNFRRVMQSDEHRNVRDLPTTNRCAFTSPDPRWPADPEADAHRFAFPDSAPVPFTGEFGRNDSRLDVVSSLRPERR